LTTAAPLSNIADFVNGRRPISEMLVNDLETPAVELHPGIRVLKTQLVEQGALGTSMTGSGSAVFGVWPNVQSAEQAAARLRRQGLWAIAAPTLALSPAVDC